jgi:serpin B
LPFRLRVVDSLWGHKTTTFVPAFLDTLATHYGAGIYLEDFVTAPEAARTDINAWVDMQTEKRIPELMPKGSISSDVRFVIVNAVHFNAGWAEPFLPGGTSPKPFHGGDGATADVPTMTGNYAHVAYGEGDGWKVVTLPYDGGEVACDVVLPDAGRFDEIEAAMTPTWLTSVRAFQKSRPGTLYLPKFEVQGETFSVRDSLTKLGMGIAFSDAADFSGITSNDHFTLFDVMHQAFVKVDEKGTEAAAATAVAGGTASAPVDLFTMTVDRPFLFFVRDVATGTLLFVGRISSPALSELARGRAPNRFAGGGPCVGRGIDSSPSVPPAPTAEVRAATDAHCVAAWKLRIQWE